MDSGKPISEKEEADPDNNADYSDTESLEDDIDENEPVSSPARTFQWQTNQSTLPFGEEPTIRRKTPEEIRDDENRVPYAESGSKDRLIRQAMERKRMLENKPLSGQNGLEPDEFKERLEEPAFKRKNVQFQNVPNSSERKISRYNLNDDNELLGDNKFLHDNVD